MSSLKQEMILILKKYFDEMENSGKRRYAASILSGRTGISSTTIRRIASGEQEPNETTTRALLEKIGSENEKRRIKQEFLKDKPNEAYLELVPTPEIEKVITGDELDLEIFAATTNTIGSSLEEIKSISTSKGSIVEDRINKLLDSNRLFEDQKKYFMSQEKTANPDNLRILSQKICGLSASRLDRKKLICTDIEVMTDEEFDNLIDVLNEALVNHFTKMSETKRCETAKPRFLSVNIGTL